MFIFAIFYLPFGVVHFFLLTFHFQIEFVWSFILLCYPTANLIAFCYLVCSVTLKKRPFTISPQSCSICFVFCQNRNSTEPNRVFRCDICSSLLTQANRNNWQVIYNKENFCISHTESVMFITRGIQIDQRLKFNFDELMIDSM